jgi:putative endonuclease
VKTEAFLLFMTYYVYIIFSQTNSYFYKGSTDDPVRRLKEHNEGRNTSTKGKGPWQMVFIRSFASKAEAQREEKRLKRTNTPYINWLIMQPLNEISEWQQAL